MKKALVFVLVAACGGAVSQNDAGNGDAASGKDASVLDGGGTFPDASTFCTGSVPRLMINGSEVDVLDMSGKVVALDCCDGCDSHPDHAALRIRRGGARSVMSIA